MVATLAYVGNTSYHLSQTVDINTVPAERSKPYSHLRRQLWCAPAATMPTTIGLIWALAGINMVENEGNATTMGCRPPSGPLRGRTLTLSAAYTFSHALDVIDAQLFNNLDNPMNPGYQYGTAGFDRRHIAIVNFDYNLPIFENSQRVYQDLVGGWAISGIALMQSGNPLSVNAGNDNLGFGGNTTNHADRVGPITYPHTFKQWFSPNAFAQPAPLTWGNGRRNTVKGPGRDNWNLSLYKDFHFTERTGFQFRAETFQYLEPYPVHRG